MSLSAKISEHVTKNISTAVAESVTPVVVAACEPAHVVTEYSEEGPLLFGEVIAKAISDVMRVLICNICSGSVASTIVVTVTDMIAIEVSKAVGRAVVEGIGEVAVAQKWTTMEAAKLVVENELRITPVVTAEVTNTVTETITTALTGVANEAFTHKVVRRAVASATRVLNTAADGTEKVLRREA